MQGCRVVQDPGWAGVSGPGDGSGPTTSMALRWTTSRTEVGVLLKREAQCLLAPADVPTIKIDDADQELLNRLVQR